MDLNAPTLFVRTAPGQVRSASAADATRPILPVNGGFRQINVVENLGVADYDGLQTMLRWQNERSFVSVSYTLSKATGVHVRQAGTPVWPGVAVYVKIPWGPPSSKPASVFALSIV